MSAGSVVGHDCNRCRWWHPDGADVSATSGACMPLNMVTVAVGGGCVDHYLPDETREE